MRVWIPDGCCCCCCVTEHDCLWRKKSQNYNNRPLRLRLLEALSRRLADRSASFSGTGPDAGVASVQSQHPVAVWVESHVALLVFQLKT